MKKQLVAAAAAFLAMAGHAAALTTYLLPDSFWPTDRSVSIEGAYAGQFFTPQIAVAPDMVVVSPDGSRGTADSVEVTGSSTRLGLALLSQGTYRFSTGEKMGQVTTLVSDGAGGWRPLGQGETPAADVQTTTLQAVTVSDVYVTRVAATRQAVDAPIGRLALHPITHPDQVTAAGGFDVELLFDGQPFPNMPVVVYAAGDPDTKLDRYVVTDAQGRAHIAFDAPGQYVIAVRHRTQAPAGSAAAVASYTTTLTLEAYDAVPTVTEAPERPQRPTTPTRRRVGRPDLH